MRKVNVRGSTADSIIKKVMGGMLDILLPKRCVGCGREGKYICDKCEVFLGEAVNNIDSLVSIWEYEGIVEKMIWRIKYNGQTHVIDELVEKAFEVMAKDISRFTSFLTFLSRPDTYITYVPMYQKKEKQRGFNQAELIAQKLGFVLSRTKHKPMEVLALLGKIKDNRSQVGLSPRERIENVKGVFELAVSDTARPENVLLVDDIYTTGATINEGCKVLRKNGVKNIWSFVLARKFNI